MTCTEGVGLKLRGSKQLMEVKVRGLTYECGAEQWSKLAAVHSKAGTDPENLQQAFRKELQKIRSSAQGYLDQDCIQSLDGALSSTWTNKLVSVTKQVTKDSVGGVSVEQSDLTITTDKQHTPTQWRTICLESHSLSKIEQLLRSEVKDKVEVPINLGEYLREVPNSVVQGYPSFILGRAAE